MDPSIPHHLRKIRLDTVPAPPSRQVDSEYNPPPAYTARPEQQYQFNQIKQIDTNEDFEENEEDAPHEITIDATTAISGSCNVLQLDIAAQGARLAAALASLLRESNSSPTLAGCPSLQQSTEDGSIRRRPMKILVNCGVRILGQRNVVGAPSIVQPVSVAANDENGPRRAGVKRKAEDDGDASSASVAKSRAVGSGNRPAI